MIRHVAMCGLVACWAATAAAEDVVRLGNLKFAHYGAVSFMKEMGAKYGLRIEERVFPKGIDIIPGILAGEIDIAASAADSAIAGRAAGAPVFAVAGFAKGGARIIGRADLGLHSVADLRGKRVGVPRGGAQEILLYAELNQALMQKQIDAMCQSEPQSTQALVHGIGNEIAKPYHTPLGEPVRVMVMTEKLYSNHDLALRVMKCFVDATRHFMDDPALAERYVREQMFRGQLTPREYRDAMANAAFTYDLAAEHIQVTTDLMVKYGVGKLKNPPQATNWVRLDLLRQAKAALGISEK